MNRHTTRLLSALLAGGVLLATAAAAIGAGNTITLNLKGGRSQNKTACSALHHYAAYRKGGTLRMDGYVTPAPALPDKTWRVKIKIKQCKNGRFVTVWQRHAAGNSVLVNGVKEGHYRISYRMRTKGYFFARAYYYGYQPTVISQDQHFHVTR
ncbi:MAG TPA: hypothetical protein VFJ11_07400 [Gaiellaceae bacterium]|nr:hypothetical protein [Gaiellaceae bacterium]